MKVFSFFFTFHWLSCSSQVYVVRDLQCGIILAGLTVFDEVGFFFFTALVIKLVSLAVLHGQPCIWFYVLCNVAETNLRKHTALLLHCLPK